MDTSSNHFLDIVIKFYRLKSILFQVISSWIAKGEKAKGKKCGSEHYNDYCKL